MSKLLIDDYPIIVLPKLATAVGVNEAMILQQIHYWAQKYKKDNDQKHYQDGRWWVYNTIKEWQDNFPFFSESTIKRTLNSLRESGIVETGNYNKVGFDRTLWYTINYDKLNQLCPNDEFNLSTPLVQTEQINQFNLNTPIPETTIDYNRDKEEEEDEESVFENSETAEVFKTAQAEIGVITPSIKDLILDAMDTYPKEWIIEAIKLCSINGVRKWGYAESILQNWHANGFKADTRNKNNSSNSKAKKDEIVYGDRILTDAYGKKAREMYKNGEFMGMHYLET